MKIIHIKNIIYVIFLIYSLPFPSFGQNQGLDVRSKDPNFNPLYYYEGKLYPDNSVCELKDLAYAFVEGDSNFIKRYYGSLENDTSFVKEIFGPSATNRGIDFLLTKKRSSRLTIKDFKNYIKRENILIKIGVEPLTIKENVVKKLNMDKIKPHLVIENFKLTKWDTGEEKIYTLLVISRIK